jgi:hypothetical protein
MKDERVWDMSICNIGHPCTNCINSCTFKIRKDKNMEQDKYPCDNCPPPHMCGYCTLCEEWEKTHPKNETETKKKYDWE